MSHANVLAGKQGGITTLERYGVAQLKEWGKRGGRPKNQSAFLIQQLIANGAKIAPGHEVGRKDTSLFILQACPRCGKERWVRLTKGKPESTYCRRCAGFLVKWKGGRRYHDGYIHIKLAQADNFYSSMAGTMGYVLEHRLVVAKSLGRCLHPWEVVHHKDGDKTNNTLANLELATKNNHASDHNKGYRDGFDKGFLDGRLQRIKDLQAEVAKLKLENTTLRQNTIQKV